MPKAKLSTQQRAEAIKLKLAELAQEYAMMLYFETMPEYDPLYKYCYATANLIVPYDYQSVDAWVRAVIKHMGLRRRGHGGAVSDAEVVSIPSGLSDAGIDNWIKYVSHTLRKKAKRKHSS